MTTSDALSGIRRIAKGYGSKIDQIRFDAMDDEDLIILALNRLSGSLENEFETTPGLNIYHLTTDGKSVLCGWHGDTDPLAIHITYALRTLDRGEWCTHCRALFNTGHYKEA